MKTGSTSISKLRGPATTLPEYDKGVLARIGGRHIHVAYTTDQTCYRFVLRIDGRAEEGVVLSFRDQKGREVTGPAFVVRRERYILLIG